MSKPNAPDGNSSSSGLQRILIGSRRRRTTTAVAVTVAAALAVGAAIALVVVLTPGATSPPPPDPELAARQRVDCLFDAASSGGRVPVDRANCEARGCRFDADVGADDAAIGAPACYFPNASSVLGFDVIRGPSVVGGADEFLLRSRGSRLFGGDLPLLRLRVSHLTDSTLRVKITSAGASRHEVPPPVPQPETRNRRPRYKFQLQRSPFAFSVKRRATGQTIFGSLPTSLIYADQLIQVATQLPTEKIMGLGETVKQRLMIQMDKFRTWALFARDEPVFNEHRNHYGVHPFYVAMEPDNSAHGVLFLNSNAMEFVTTPGPKLIHRTTGGVLDMFFFLGPDPESAVSQYHSVVGRPMLPPYWSLGFHLSRYGFRSLRQLNDTLERNLRVGLPIDTVHLDIDHMRDRMAFTVDPVGYAGLKRFLTERRRTIHLRNIAITNPVIITNVSNYRPFELGRQMDAFVRWPSAGAMPPGDFEILNDTVLLGWVWPTGRVAFVDFFKESAKKYWAQLLREHHSVVPFDGIWIDMNEPANFGTNEERPWNWPEGAKPYWSLKCSNKSLLEMPPYRPSAAYYWDEPNKKVAQLSDKTVCMDAVHDVEGGGRQRHYDLHSLYGRASEAATAAALRGVRGGRRQLILSRSNFPGSGASAGTWLGDNDSSGDHMRAGTVGMLEFNAFGLPYVGADVCGFFGEASPELCTLWMQVGAFYPFSRNHNFRDSPDQDPAAYQQRCPGCVRKMVAAVRQRYRFHPHLYTLLHRANWHGGTVVRPLFFNFPHEEQLHFVDESFMWGDSLLISPQMQLGGSQLTYWLPPGLWYDITDIGDAAGDRKFGRFWRLARATNHTVAVGSDTSLPLLHLRGGTCLFATEAARNTHEQIQSGQFHLIIAMNADDIAQGELIWDDGETDHSTIAQKQQQLFHATVNCAHRRCLLHPAHDGVPQQRKQLRSVTILQPVGSDEPAPAELLLNGRPLQFRSSRLAGDAAAVAMVTDLQLPVDMTQRLEIVWSSSSSSSAGEAGRIDCSPENPTLPAAACAARGCRHDAAAVGAAPKCFFGEDRPNSYAVSSGCAGQQCAARKADKFDIYSPGPEKISVAATQLQSGALRMRVTDASRSRYEVPLDIDASPRRASAGAAPLRATIGNGAAGRMRLRVARGDGSFIFDTEPAGGFVFEEQFLQIAAALPTEYVFGLGEHTHTNLKHRFDYGTWPMFSRDQPVGGQHGNFYGVHPILIGRDAAGGAFGIFFLNSNGQEVQFVPNSTIAYRSIGGIFDIFFFPGPSVAAVVSQYTALTGRPTLPPHWALGFHLCRYGYGDLATLAATVERNVAAGVPIDVQYADIDHMEANKIFTVDRRAFAGLSRFVRDIKARRGIRFVYILDPTVVTNETGYRPYDDGLAADVFVKWPAGSSPDFDIYGNHNLLGFAWPTGRVAFPDFCADRGRRYWLQQIRRHADALPFDGLWLDMNEPANFGTNEERPWNWPEDARPYWSLKCNLSDPIESPPYRTKMWGNWISDKTICMSALHCDGRYRHYDVHSLYGQMQAIATDTAVKAVTGRRGLVITRATFPGDGRYGGTWLGDNGKSWRHLRDSLIGVVEHGFFGVPFVGADICGYFGAAVDRDLCLRWSQAGAWYPYSRSHNGLTARPHDPAAFDSRATAAIRESLVDRYRLLPYLYTQMYLAMLRGVQPVRPMFHDFASDPIAWDIDTQLLWGPAVLVCPNLFPHTATTHCYLPAGTAWFDYYTGERISEGGELLRMSTPEDRIAIALAAGHIVAAYADFEEFYGSSSFFNTASLHGRGLHLIATVAAGTAGGEVFLDDGESLDPGLANSSLLLEFDFYAAAGGDSILRLWWGAGGGSGGAGGSVAVATARVDSLSVLGGASWSSAIASGSCRFDGGRPKFEFDARRGVSELHNIRLLLLTGAADACHVTLH